MSKKAKKIEWRQIGKKTYGWTVNGERVPKGVKVKEHPLFGQLHAGVL